MVRINNLQLNKQEIIGILLAIILGVSFFINYLYGGNENEPAAARPSALLETDVSNSEVAKEYKIIYEQLFPSDGYEIPVKLGDSIVRLVEGGAIDIDKFKKLYDSRGGLSEEQLKTLTQPSDENLRISFDNSNFLLNVLWALGLANKNPILDEGIIITKYKKDLGNFASTGGWTLGKEKNGAAYFSKLEIVKLDPDQQKIAKYVAENTFRPCCGNSTAFPDCNHGAALLGLIELAASQGQSQKQIFDMALKVNSFWFPDTYLKTALYFKLNKGIGWEKINSEEIMGYDYSSIGGWMTNVKPEIDKIQQLLPGQGGGGGCGV